VADHAVNDLAEVSTTV